MLRGSYETNVIYILWAKRVTEPDAFYVNRTLQDDHVFFFQFFILVYITLREERRLRFLENRVLRRIFGPKEGRGNRGMEKTT